MAIQDVARERSKTQPSHGSLVLPAALCAPVLRALERVADVLVAIGVSANAVTCTCLFLGAVGGVLLALGAFGPAGLVMVAASLGDALDGLVARRGGSASDAGALLDAAGDRYQEFFFIGGLAVYFSHSTPALVVTLLALAGSFMVSYGSAKAEALGAEVPPGAMRRPERAVCLCAASALMGPWTWVVSRYGLAAWTDNLPVLAAVALIALVANVSAIRRLRLIALRTQRHEAVGDSAAAENDSRLSRLPVSRSNAKYTTGVV